VASFDNQNDKVVYRELSYRIIGIAFEVFNQLGYGHKEKIFENAIAQGLLAKDIKFKEQVGYKLTYKEKIVGKYYLDFLIDEKIVVEIKKGGHFPKRNIDQIKWYIKATNLKLAILINFTPTGIKFLRVLGNQTNL
jgi:GxxExxY protein